MNYNSYIRTFTDEDKKHFTTAKKMSAEVMNVDVKLIPLKTRKREIVMTRQLICFLIKETFEDKYSLRMIGDQIGGFDHASVLHSVKVIQDLIDTDKKFAETVAYLLHEYKEKVLKGNIFDLIEKAKLKNILNGRN